MASLPRSLTVIVPKTSVVPPPLRKLVPEVLPLKFTAEELIDVESKEELTTAPSPSTPSFSQLPLRVRQNYAAAKIRGRYRVMKATFGWAGSITTTGAGLISSSTALSVLPTVNAEFPSYAALFEEFFVTKFTVTYVPYNRYQWSPNATPGTNNVNVPLVAVPMHHGVSAYASMVLAMENEKATVHSSADPFTVVWNNVESPNDKTVVNSSTSAATPTQGWCLTSATPASGYTGYVQLISSATIGTASAQTFGQLFVKYYVLFRIKA